VKTNVQVNRYNTLEMLTKCIKRLLFVPNALSFVCGHKCTAHVWFAQVFKLSFSGISVFVLRVKLDGRYHFNEKLLEKDGYKSWLQKDKNAIKAFCFACKKSINQNIGLNTNILLCL